MKITQTYKSDGSITYKIVYFPGTDQIMLIVRRRNGLPEGNDGEPAEIWYYENGNIKIAEFCKNGDLHRIGKPAKLSYYEDGVLRRW
jgi:antitoxin component YwqK of YwqJK toxin-antitoxin module